MRIGVLVECDASIKAIIVKINSEDNNAYIIEDIDDEHVLIQASKHEQLKARLNAVRRLRETYNIRQLMLNCIDIEGYCPRARGVRIGMSLHRFADWSGRLPRCGLNSTRYSFGNTASSRHTSTYLKESYHMLMCH
jgi:TFIIH basal transcription factor complex TTD-A subunit